MLCLIKHKMKGASKQWMIIATAIVLLASIMGMLQQYVNKNKKTIATLETFLQSEQVESEYI